MMGRVMPCEEPLAGEIWLSDITVEGMRLGERLVVFAARRRAPCWAGPPDMVGVLDAAGLALSVPLLSESGLADVLSGVTACRGEAPRDEPPAAPAAEEAEREVWGEP